MYRIYKLLAVPKSIISSPISSVSLPISRSAASRHGMSEPPVTRGLQQACSLFVIYVRTHARCPWLALSRTHACPARPRPVPVCFRRSCRLLSCHLMAAAITHHRTGLVSRRRYQVGTVRGACSRARHEVSPAGCRGPWPLGSKQRWAH